MSRCNWRRSGGRTVYKPFICVPCGPLLLPGAAAALDAAVFLAAAAAAAASSG